MHARGSAGKVSGFCKNCRRRIGFAGRAINPRIRLCQPDPETTAPARDVQRGTTAAKAGEIQFNPIASGPVRAKWIRTLHSASLLVPV
jgi:hypothetical protein